MDNTKNYSVEYKFVSGYEGVLQTQYVDGEWNVFSSKSGTEGAYKGSRLDENTRNLNLIIYYANTNETRTFGPVVLPEGFDDGEWHTIDTTLEFGEPLEFRMTVDRDFCGNLMTDIVVKFWYPEVVEDIGKITDAMNYYREILLDGQKHLNVKGYLQKLLEQQAGLLRIYADAHTDCSMVWKWLDETIKHEKAKKRLWYHSQEGREQYGELKKTDLDVIIHADTDIKDLIDIQLLVELWKNSLGHLVEQLKTRGITLAMISKVRMSGEHEAFIDATKESNPEQLG